jgi:hypothetical protein
MVELHLHSPIRLHSVVLNSLIMGLNLSSLHITFTRYNTVFKHPSALMQQDDLNTIL